MAALLNKVLIRKQDFTVCRLHLIPSTQNIIESDCYLNVAVTT